MVQIKDIPSEIQWHEGMLLSPQHFQRMSLGQHTLLRFYASLLDRYSWGISTYELDNTAVVDGILRVRHVEALLPDGALVYYDGQTASESLEIDFQKSNLLQENKSVSIYLTVPTQYGKRYQKAVDEGVPDWNNADNRMDLPVLKPVPKLVVEDDLQTMAAHIPLAKIAIEEGTFVLSEFLPPLLSMSTSPKIKKQCIKLADLMRSKSEILSSERKHQEITEAPGMHAEISSKVEKLVSALPLFEALIADEYTSPHHIYLILNHIAGQVCSLNTYMTPPRFSAYDHNDIMASCHPLFEYIASTIDQISKKYLTITLHPNDDPVLPGYVRFTIEPEQLLSEKPILIGFYSRTTHNAEAGLAWLRTAFVASEDQINNIIQHRILGAHREIISEYEPLHLIPREGVVLFRIESDDFITPGQPVIICGSSHQQEASVPDSLILYVDNQPENLGK